MLTEKDLKEKYQNLSYDQKIKVGTALVKVNMGVAQPQDLRDVASFLKGSVYIAKPETLDRLIEFLHSGKSSQKNDNDTTNEVDPLIESPTLEDLESMYGEITAKEKI